MDLEHLKATIWMRWRILANRVKRGGKLGNVLFGILIAIGLLCCLGLFVGALLIGVSQLPGAKPAHILILWLVLTLTFLFSWTVGLVTDLQRSDAMSFKNLLHLPISLKWVFLYNYLGSFVSLSVAIFVPPMLGLCLAMVIVSGPLMLIGFPLVLGFLVMITALTYQLRGWLSRLMENKRRGRNVVAAITVGFVLLAQVPNLLHLGFADESREQSDLEHERHEELALAARTEDATQADKDALTDFIAESSRETDDRERMLDLCAMILPIGWLPYGMRSSFDGHLWPGLLCAMGMLTIGSWSLRRSYRTTVLASIGASIGSSSGKAPLQPAAPERVEASGATESGARKLLMVQRSLPLVSESTAGVAFANLRSLMRAPEAKMLMLSPLIIFGAFGLILSKQSGNDWLGLFAPMMSLGVITLALLSVMQLIQNQFGLDRAGFRAYLLSPIPRHKILLGKNLATAPLAIGLGLVALSGLQFFVPSDLSHFLGACLQLVSAYLLLCMVGNMISILGPMRLKEHAMKAANAKFKTILWQILPMLLIPITLSPLLIPSSLEFLLVGQSWARGIPLFLPLHAAGLVAIYILYRWILLRQGTLLQEREQRILDVLTRN